MPFVPLLDDSLGLLLVQLIVGLLLVHPTVVNSLGRFVVGVPILLITFHSAPFFSQRPCGAGRKQRSRESCCLLSGEWMDGWLAGCPGRWFS